MSEIEPTKTGLASTDLAIASHALRNIQRQSEIAVEDSQLVEEHGYLRAEVRLDQDLYVTRTVEREIFANLDREAGSRAPSVLVVGEAGYGKTSLLWRVFHVLKGRTGWEPWLIKATLLSLDPSETRQDARNAGIVWSGE
ncbi:MAG TPA: ATP-binding protein, partial [Pyrinomonadaceae bacterium]|nr:ATP-binding protein [Pyrinomonadaceae bacterium]